MRLLLDTHIFLWYITGDARFERPIRKSIEDADVVFVSVASVWEATIKYRLGKLPLPESPSPWLTEQRERHGFESLLIDESSVSYLGSLPSHHRDPFDRMLICQALQHDLHIVTADPVLSFYPAKLLPLG